MGLEEFKGTEIRFGVMGIKITIVEVIVAKAIRCRSHCMFMVDTNRKNEWARKIHKTLHEGRQPYFFTCKEVNAEYLADFKGTPYALSRDLLNKICQLKREKLVAIYILRASMSI